MGRIWKGGYLAKKKMGLSICLMKKRMENRVVF